MISFTDRMSFLEELSEFEFLKKLRKEKSVEQETSDQCEVSEYDWTEGSKFDFPKSLWSLVCFEFVS